MFIILICCDDFISSVQFSSVAQSCPTLVTPWTGSYDNSIFNFLRQLYTVIQCQTLFFWAPKSLQMVTAAMKLKDAYSLEGKL